MKSFNEYIEESNRVDNSLLSTFREFQSAHKNDKIEHYVLILADGTKMSGSGDTNSADLSSICLRVDVEGAILIHNHPDDTTLSAADLRFLERFKLKYIVATTNDGIHIGGLSRENPALGFIGSMNIKTDEFKKWGKEEIMKIVRKNGGKYIARKDLDAVNDAIREKQLKYLKKNASPNGYYFRYIEV